MEHYRTGVHTRYDIKYHFVWVTKYRKRVLTGAVSLRVRDLVREICLTNDIEISQGAVSTDHVHVWLSCPPNISPSKAMQYIKGKTSRKLLMEFQHFKTVLGSAFVFESHKSGAKDFQSVAPDRRTYTIVPASCFWRVRRKDRVQTDCSR